LRLGREHMDANSLLYLRIALAHRREDVVQSAGRVEVTEVSQISPVAVERITRIDHSIEVAPEGRLRGDHGLASCYLAQLGARAVTEHVVELIHVREMEFIGKGVGDLLAPDKAVARAGGRHT